MKKIILAAAALTLLSGCGKIVENAIKNNPEIVFNAIKEDPRGFMNAVNSTREQMEKMAAEEAQMQEAKELEDAFNNPQSPNIEGRPFIGKADAPITIVEYADFACGYCGRAKVTLDQVRKEYGDKVKFIYKHFPVLGVPASLTASKMMEAMTRFDVEKAFKFNSIVFENQSKLRDEKAANEFLKSEARKLMGPKYNEVIKLSESKEIEEAINADIAEASGQFQLRGTPAFNINGVFLKGAYPFDKFKEVIDRHLQKN